MTPLPFPRTTGRGLRTPDFRFEGRESVRSQICGDGVCVGGQGRASEGRPRGSRGPPTPLTRPAFLRSSPPARGGRNLGAPITGPRTRVYLGPSLPRPRQKTRFSCNGVVSRRLDPPGCHVPASWGILRSLGSPRPDSDTRTWEHVWGDLLFGMSSPPPPRGGRGSRAFAPHHGCTPDPFPTPTLWGSGGGLWGPSGREVSLWVTRTGTGPVSQLGPCRAPSFCRSTRRPARSTQEGVKIHRLPHPGLGRPIPSVTGPTTPSPSLPPSFR